MKDVQVGNKVIRQLEVKLFVTSMLLQELLDETQGNTRFKHKLKHHISGLQNELAKVLTAALWVDGPSFALTDASSPLEATIEGSPST